MTQHHPVNRVIIVEDRAHLSNGHFPNRFAELADGFTGIGVGVTALTRCGWSSGRGEDRHWSLAEYDRLSAGLVWVADRLAGQQTGASARATKAQYMLRTIAALVSATRLARSIERTTHSARVGVVLLNFNSTPEFVSLVVRRPWIVHLFREAPPARRTAWLTRVRRSPVAVCVSSPEFLEAAARGLPGVRRVLVRLAGVREPMPESPTPMNPFGLSGERRVALLFGSGHPLQDPATAVEALRRRKDWQLLAVGTIVNRVRAALEAHPGDWAFPPILVDGPVDNVTRDLAYRVADTVILSFAPGYRLNSGTLMDAISYRRTVIASSNSAAADTVTASGIGLVFDTGNAESLGGALDRIASTDCSAALDLAATSLSNKSIAAAHLDVLRRLESVDDDLVDYRTELTPALKVAG